MANIKQTSLYEGDKKTPFPVRIQNGVEDWYSFTKDIRKARHRMLKHYSAGYYENKEVSQPLNLVDRGVQIIAPFLVTHNPKVLIDAKRDMPTLKGYGRTFELAIEHLLREINFADYTMRPAVINSLFSMGIVKTGIMTSHQVEIFGYLHDVGQPYADNIDFEDYIGDIKARDRQENEIEGHWYTLPEEYVRTSGLYKNHDLLETEYDLFGPDRTRPEEITKQRTRFSRNRELKRSVRLCDIWLPDENIVITLPPKGYGEKIMRTVEWEGFETGPFDVLGYRYFPNSVIPIPPVYTWMFLNNTINRLVLKMTQQAEREKHLMLYDLGMAEDAKRVMETRDDGTVGVRSTDGFKEMQFGGFNDQSMPFVQYLEQQYSITGGNLYTIGGRTTGADTLGQEQMLQANASKQLDDMVNQVHNFTKRIVEKLAKYLWTDPMIEKTMIKRDKGQELEVSYNSAQKEGDFLDYGVDIEPYSMSKKNPDIRFQQYMQFISQIVLPTAQIAAAQGSSLKVDAVIKEAARFLDIRNIDDWYQSSVPQDQQMNPYQPQQEKPKNGQGDGRFSGGDNMASNMNNLIQKQASDPSGQGTPGASPAGATTKGM